MTAEAAAAAKAAAKKAAAVVAMAEEAMAEAERAAAERDHVAEQAAVDRAEQARAEKAMAAKEELEKALAEHVATQQVVGGREALTEQDADAANAAGHLGAPSGFRRESLGALARLQQDSERPQSARASAGRQSAASYMPLPPTPQDVQRRFLDAANAVEQRQYDVEVVADSAAANVQYDVEVVADSAAANEEVQELLAAPPEETLPLADEVTLADEDLGEVSFSSTTSSRAPGKRWRRMRAVAAAISPKLPKSPMGRKSVFSPRSPKA